MNQLNQLIKVEDLNDYVSKFLANSISQKDQKMFLEIAKAFQLNPFKREIYCVPFGNKCNILVGYEVYLKRAERTGKLNGWNVEVVGEGLDLTAKVVIYRKDWTHPFKHEVLFSEYNQNTSIWKSKPRTMIRKVAISQAFRLAFPEDLGGLPYVEEEIETMKDISPNNDNKVEKAIEAIKGTRDWKDLTIVADSIKTMGLTDIQKARVVPIYKEKENELKILEIEKEWKEIDLPPIENLPPGTNIIASNFDLNEKQV